MKKQYNLITSILTSLVNEIKFTKDDTTTFTLYMDAEVDFVYREVNIKYNFTHTFPIVKDEPNGDIQDKKDLMSQLLVDSILRNLSGTEKNISEREGHELPSHPHLDDMGKRELELIYYMDKAVLELFASKHPLQSSIMRNEKLLTSFYQDYMEKAPLPLFDTRHPLAGYIQDKEVK